MARSLGKGADTAELERGRLLASTTTNPLRLRLLVALWVESPLGADALAERTDEPLHRVRRHLNALVAAGLVKIDRKEGRRGAAKRFFALDGELSIGIAEDELLSDRERRRYTVGIIRVIFDEATRAASSPELGRRVERVIANVPGRVDERGWRELSELHHEMLERATRIVAESRRRLEEDGDEPIGVISEQILLEAPQHSPDAPL